MAVFISSIPTMEQDDLELCKELLRNNRSQKISESGPGIKLPGFEDEQHFFTNTGRASLYIILKALGLEKEDEVLVQSFTCMALVVPILWVGAIPIYVDIDENTYNMSLDSIRGRVTDKTRVVVVQHTFGISADIENIKEYIDSVNLDRGDDRKVYLIEDCAHCLNVKHNDKYLGQYGDASFFSFGQDKVVSCTQGGCLISNDSVLEQRIEEVYKDIPEMSKGDVRYNLRYPLLWNIIKKTYYFPSFLANRGRFSRFTLGKFLILLFRYIGLTKQQASTTEFGSSKDVYRLSKEQMVLLSNQLGKLDRLTEHRERVVDAYSKGLGLSLSGSLLRYPVFVDDPISVKKKLQGIRVLSGNWYNSPVIPKGIDLYRVGYHLGTCPNAEYLTEHIVNLPTGVDTDRGALQSIVEVLY